MLDANPHLACAAAVDAATGATRLTARGALRNFDPRRLVPVGGFLYQRGIAGVWTRHRQECNFGRRCQTGEPVPDRPAAATETNRLDPELAECLAVVLKTFDERARGLLRELFRGGRSEHNVARELGISRQAVNDRL